MSVFHKPVPDLLKHFGLIGNDSQLSADDSLTIRNILPESVDLRLQAGGILGGPLAAVREGGDPLEEGQAGRLFFLPRSRRRILCRGSGRRSRNRRLGGGDCGRWRSRRFGIGVSRQCEGGGEAGEEEFHSVMRLAS
jgi:hypothetical protein